MNLNLGKGYATLCCDHSCSHSTISLFLVPILLAKCGELHYIAGLNYGERDSVVHCRVSRYARLQHVTQDCSMLCKTVPIKSSSILAFHLWFKFCSNKFLKQYRLIQSTHNPNRISEGQSLCQTRSRETKSIQGNLSVENVIWTQLAVLCREVSLIQR